MKKKTKSDEIEEKLCAYISEYNEVYNANQQMLNEIFRPEDDPELREVKETLQSIKLSIESCIDDLYHASVNDDYYFYDCPFGVYKNTLEERRKRFIKENIDAEELDFLKDELNRLYFPSQYDRRFFIYDYGAFFKNFQNFRISHEKKKKYIISKLKELGWELKYIQGEEIEIGYDNYEMQEDSISFVKIKKEEIPEINIKDSKQLTINQIVLLLQETGFFSHPKIEQAPKTKQSELISLLTGLNQKNIKTQIEKLDKKPSENGATYQKDIDKIDQLLDDLIK